MIILISATVFVVTIQLIRLGSKLKNEKGERLFFNPTRMYAIQLRLEKLFNAIHTRKD